MATALQIESVSFEDYIAGERDVEFRSEYVDGQVYAMAGASEALELESVALTVDVAHVYRRVRKEVGLEMPFAAKE